LRYFNPRLYFSSGDGNFLNGLTNFGPLLLIFILPFFRGLKNLFINKRELFNYLAFLIVFAIIPAVFTYPFPALSKSIFIIFPIVFVIAYGMDKLNRKILIGFVLLLIINVSVVLYDAVNKEPYRDLEQRMYSYRDLAREVTLHKDSYNKVFITNSYGSDPSPSLLFYMNINPASYHRNETKPLVYRNYINQFDNIIIDQKEKWILDRNYLYIITPDELESNPLFYGIDYKIKSRIVDLSGKEIYLFIEYLPKTNVK